jgi:hypothetical protein
MEWVCVMCESETATLNCGRGAEAPNADILSTTVMCVCADRGAVLPTVMTIWLRLERDRTGVNGKELDSTRKNMRVADGAVQARLFKHQGLYGSGPKSVTRRKGTPSTRTGVSHIFA